MNQTNNFLTRQVKRLNFVPGSTASCQSTSGFSSTSSFSEDESSELENSGCLSKDTSLSQEKSVSREGKIDLSRQSSVSLEDITILSNFNSNYYALDFSLDSPTKHQLSDSQVKDRSENNSLVKECRKIEASLRAMSTGCLIEKDIKIKRHDVNEKKHGNQQKCQHGSLESLKNYDTDTNVSIRSPKIQRKSHSSSSNSVHALQLSRKSNISPLLLSPNKPTSFVSAEDLSQNGSLEGRSPIDIYLDDDDDVFLASNDISEAVKSSPMKGSLTSAKPKAPVSDHIDSSFDQVDVQFKPERQGSIMKLRNRQKDKQSKVNEKSVFGFLKSKVLEIFSSNDNGAKLNNSDQVNHKILPKTNNHVKQMCMAPEIPQDLIGMAAELNFKVREFPLSSCQELPKDGESSNSPGSPSLWVKFDVGGDNLEGQTLSQIRMKHFRFRQESVENYSTSPRYNRKLERGDSFEKNSKSSRCGRRLERKVSSSQFQRNNSGNDLLKSAIRNSTIKQSSPTLEQSRSNPFIVRSFSSDYVEDPSTTYPFKNMVEDRHDVIKVESPEEVLSVEQTLYDCFIKIDIDKLKSCKTDSNSVQTGKKRGSLESEISVDSVDLDDQWEYGETMYGDEVLNMIGNGLNPNKGDYEKIKRTEESNKNETGKSVWPGHHSGENEVMANAVSNGSDPRCCVEYRNYSESGQAEENHTEGSRGVQMKHSNADLKDMYSKQQETNCEIIQAKTEIHDTKSTEVSCHSEIPDVSCIGKATEGNVSTKLCRYYHVFKEGELEKLIASHIKDLQVVQCFYDHANWCLLAVKIQPD